MVTAWIIKQKFLDKQKKREDAIRAEVLAEANRRVQEWNWRRLTARPVPGRALPRTAARFDQALIPPLPPDTPKPKYPKPQEAPL